MTEREFEENITSWDLLLECCDNYDRDICSKIYTREELDQAIEADVFEGMSLGLTWREVLHGLREIDDSHDHYYHASWLNFIGISDDDDVFLAYKAYALAFLRTNVWGSESTNKPSECTHDTPERDFSTDDISMLLFGDDGI